VQQDGVTWFGPTAELDLATFGLLFTANVQAPYFLTAEDGRRRPHRHLNENGQAPARGDVATVAWLRTSARPAARAAMRMRQ
jgi:hypothetical protein